MKNFYATKWWTIMKICATQIIMVTLLFGVAMAHDNYGQLLDREVSVSITNTSLDEALQQVAHAAAIKFAYSREVLNADEKITLVADHKQLREILDELFIPRGIKYLIRQDGKTISLKRSSVQEGDAGEILDIVENHNEVVRTLITGIVTDVDKQPLAGVNILLKGTTMGTTTNHAGAYSINAESSDVLIFSFIGFASSEIKVNEQTNIDVILNEDVKGLSEVIVNAGYWEVKEREQTGNIGRVGAGQIEKQPVSNPLQALQGRMTGVYIQQNTGMPGGGFSIQIRGQNSLRNGINGGVNGNLPLYLVDGVPFSTTSLTSSIISNGNLGGGNPLSTINPNDIEAIEVLKDADATAIYGARGANGVVLITTKRAKSGKAKIDLDIYQGIGQVKNTMDLLNATSYLFMRREAYRNDGLQPNAIDAPDLLLWDTTRNTNWQKELIGGQAKVTNAQVNFSAGSEHTQMLFGGGYYRESTVMPGSNTYQRGSGRLSINHSSFSNRLKIASTINYSASVNQLPSTDLTSLAVTLAPVAPALYDENGELNWQQNTWANPLANLKRTYKGNIENLISNASIGYEILSGLTLKSTMGYTSMQVTEVNNNPLSAYSPTDVAGRTATSYFGNSKIRTWIVEPQLDYATAVAQGVLSTLAGLTFQESVQSGQTIEGAGYTNDAFLGNLAAAPRINIIDNSGSQYRYSAIFGRVNYNWKEKYILNATGRRDGSSRFGPGNQFANFGAVGAAWLFSNESFVFDHLRFLSFGKLRASAGATGSDAIGNYQYLETYAPTTYAYGSTKGIALTRLANPEYSWETSKKMEVALDLGLWQDRLTLSNAFYRNRTSGQLVGLPLPTVTGQSSVQYNLPATVQNQGWESQLRLEIIKKDNVQWSSSLNITIPSNRLVKFPDIENFPAYASRFDLGKSTYTYKAFQSSGVDPLTGAYTFVDLDGNESISSPADLIGLKKVTQACYGGWINTFRYKGIELEVMFQFVKQTGYNYQRSFTMPGTASNQPAVVNSRWQQAGDNADIQKFTAKDPTGTLAFAYYYNVASDNIVTDASFIRLKNLSLSYRLPASWMSKAKMSNARIFMQGQNLLTFTNYVGLDPETQNSQVLPPLCMITAGLHVTL